MGVEISGRQEEKEIEGKGRKEKRERKERGKGRKGGKGREERGRKGNGREERKEEGGSERGINSALPFPVLHASLLSPAK